MSTDGAKYSLPEEAGGGNIDNETGAEKSDGDNDAGDGKCPCDGVL